MVYENQKRARRHLFSRGRLLPGMLIVLGLMMSALGMAAQAGGEKLRINMDNGEVRNFINWISQETGKTFVVDPRVKGRVNIVSHSALSREEAWQMFLSVMQMQGFEVLEGQGSWQILPNTLARTSGIPFSQSGGGQELVVRVVRPSHVSTNQLISVLRPLVSQNGHMASIQDSNALVIADHARTIETLEKIIRQVDRTGDLQIELVSLKYATAMDVVDVVQALMSSSGRAAEASGNKLVIAADARTNSILLSGDAARRKVVKETIYRLDRLEESKDNTEVVYLYYIKAKEAAKILQKITGTMASDGKGSASPKGQVTIEPSDSTNAVVVNAPPAVMKTVKRIISKLDIRRAQVLVEAVIVEMTDNGRKELGVEWGTTSSSKGKDGWFGGTLPENLASGKGSILGGGLSLGFYRNGSLRFLLKALQSDARSNILSTPNLVTIDNEEAKIVVGQNVPFLTGRETNAASGTNNPFQTIERKDVGLQLTITPHINRGNAVTLEVNQQISSVIEQPSTSKAKDLVTSQRTIKTSVLVEDGQTLVLGGLISDDLLDAESKVPLLGDIPVLGKLFTTTTKKRDRRNLMVFLRPTILKDSVVSNKLTRQRYEFVRDGDPLYGASMDELLENALGKPLLPVDDAKPAPDTDPKAKPPGAGQPLSVVTP